MIDIHINGEALDKSPGFTIQLELASPLFSDVIGYSSHSLSFRLPLTPRNRAIFQQADSVLNYQGQESYDAVVYLGGERWREGLLNIGGFAMDSVSVSLDLSEGTFSRKLGAKSLNEYEYGGDRVITAQGGNDLGTPVVSQPADSPIITHANAAANGDIDSHDYTFFPIYNEEMYSGNYRLLGGADADDYDPYNYQNWWRVTGGFWDELRQAFDSIWAGGTPDHAAYGRHPLTPFPYLIYVMRQLCKENGVTLDETGTFTSDEEIRTLALLSPVTLDRLYEYEMTFFAQTAWYSTSSHAEVIRLASIMSTGNSRAFWIEVCRLFGLATIVQNGEVKLICKKDQVNALNQIDWTKKVAAYSHTYQETGKTFGTEAGTGDTLDGMTVSSSEVESAGDVNTQLDLPVTGVEIETVYYVIAENAYYKYELVQGSQPAQFIWNFLGYRNDEVVIGDGSDKSISAIGITQPKEGDWTIASPTYGNVVWNVPQVNWPLISVPYNMPPYDFGAKLCFYRGLQENADGYEYPKGSSDADLVNGFNYSLRWTGDGNLYDTWHKDWVEMLQRSRDMTLYLNLDVTDIFDFDWLSKPRITVEDGQAVTIIKSLTVKISDSGIETTEAEAIRI